MVFNRAPIPLEDDKCFVLMPFTPSLTAVYESAIKVAVESLGLRCIRADEIPFSSPIMQDIWDGIRSASLVVADLTGRNPNVFYELGLAHALGRNVVIISQTLDDVPFDVRHVRCIIYNGSDEGRASLSNSIATYLKEIKRTQKSYCKILLDPSFANEFVMKTCAFYHEFKGLRGLYAKVREQSEMHPVVRKVTHYHKRINVPGLVRNVLFNGSPIEFSGDRADGAYSIHAEFDPPVDIGSAAAFSVQFELLDCFPDVDEFWCIKVPRPVDDFSAHFRFERGAVSDFRLLIASESGDEELASIQPRFRRSASSEMFEWANAVGDGGAKLVFKWRWRE